MKRGASQSSTLMMDLTLVTFSSPGAIIVIFNIINIIVIFIILTIVMIIVIFIIFILLRECNVSVNDTVDSLYNNFMYPEGVKAMGEAVQVDPHNNDFDCNDQNNHHD